MAVGSELVLLVSGKVGDIRKQDLALFAESARHEGDVGALRRVHRHAGAGGDALIVRVRVNEKQSTVGSGVRHGRDSTACQDAGHDDH